MNWIEEKLLGFGFGRLHQRLKKNNWISRVGGTSLIFSGIGMVLSGFNGERLDLDLVWNGFAVIGSGFTAWGYARKFERTARAAEQSLKAPQNQASRGSALTGTILLTLMLGVVTANAQTRRVWIGASADGASRPNPAGHICGIVNFSDDYSSISCISVRGGGEGKPITDLSQTFSRTLTKQGQVKIFALGGPGLSTTSTGTDWLFEGGIGISRPLWKTLGLAMAAKGAWSPAIENNAAPRFAVGFLYEPK